MKLGLKQVKNIDVYYQDQDQPFAKVFGVILNEKTKKIVAYKIKTLSLIPISMLVATDKILKTDNKKMVLKDTFCPYCNNAEDSYNIEIGNINELSCMHNLKIRDIRFDFEIGEMSDIIFSKTIFSPKFRVDAKDVLLNWRSKNV